MMALTITKEALEAAEKCWIQLRDAGSPEAATAHEEYQRLAREQTSQLQTDAHQRLISRMLR